MKNYKIINVSNLENKNIDILYSELLNQKYQFMILCFCGKKYVLTKEKSIIEINNVDLFLNNISSDIYYKTIIKNRTITVNKKDLNMFNQYINKFKNILTKNKYNDKYYFGCVAVKSENGIITTTRGKQKLDEYTFIENVDHKNHIINVINKKATLNAPLLDYLFKNNQVKIIVHLHEFDDKLIYYDYAFPGTVRDSIRNNITSFNIRHHGVIYMFDKEGRIL